MKLLVSLGAILSLTSCAGPNAWLCTFVLKDPLEESYSFCVNQKTHAEKSVLVTDMAKWITTDPDSYDIARKHYKNKCEK